MNKQDLAIAIATMEAHRKNGGFAFESFAIAGAAMGRMSALFQQMGDNDIIVIQKAEKEDGQPSEGNTK